MSLLKAVRGLGLKPTVETELLEFHSFFSPPDERPFSRPARL
jgi:hypothetical protein